MSDFLTRRTTRHSWAHGIFKRQGKKSHFNKITNKKKHFFFKHGDMLLASLLSGFVPGGSGCSFGSRSSLRSRVEMMPSSYSCAFFASASASCGRTRRKKNIKWSFVRFLPPLWGAPPHHHHHHHMLFLWQQGTPRCSSCCHREGAVACRGGLGVRLSWTDVLCNV